VGIRAGIYTRISQDREGKELGVDRQEEDCRKLAADLTFEVVEPVYSDNDLSASKRDVERPDYDRMWRDLAAGRIDAVLAYHPDRLYRRLRYLEDLVDVVEPIAKAGRKIRIETVSGEIDLSSASGRFTARLFASLAQYEAERMGERIARQKKQAASNGEWLGGRKKDFGYTRERVVQADANGKDTSYTLHHVNRAEAKVLREIASRIIAGETCERIAYDLNQRDVPSPGDARWVPSHLARSITRPFIAGLTSTGARGPWRPILSIEQHEAVKAELSRRSVRTVKLSKRRHPLTGLLWCANCRTRMWGGARVYRCSPMSGGCGKTIISAPGLERWVGADTLAVHTTDAGVEIMMGPKEDPNIVGGWFGRIASDPVTRGVDAEGAFVPLERRPEEIDDAARRDLEAELSKLLQRAAANEQALKDGTVPQDLGYRLASDLDAQIADKRQLLGRQSARSASRTITNEDVDKAIGMMRDRWDAKALEETDVALINEVLASVIERIEVSPKQPGNRGSAADYPERIRIFWRR
jgi:site-specific DNA recombinase